MDIFFGYNPFIMITVYMLLIDGIAHVIRIHSPSAATTTRTPPAHTSNDIDFDESVFSPFEKGVGFTHGSN
jgi:hypothetical protein